MCVCICVYTMQWLFVDRSYACYMARRMQFLQCSKSTKNFPSEEKAGRSWDLCLKCEWTTSLNGLDLHHFVYIRTCTIWISIRYMKTWCKIQFLFQLFFFHFILLLSIVCSGKYGKWLNDYDEYLFTLRTIKNSNSYKLALVKFTLMLVMCIYYYLDQCHSIDNYR